ncbi:MAG TPA: glycosyltransferase family 87 protein [Bryobacteraceae bacterium]|nr:glycosyltransferase family 87 protein [Bryobacteraceae bacterium]
MASKHPAANARSTVWIGLLGFLFLAAIICLQTGDRVFRGWNDFAQIYAGARLSGTPQLYSREANYQLIGEQIGTTLGGVICTRLPYYFILLKPLGWMSYRWAYLAFLFLNFAALAGFVFLARRWLPEAVLFIGWSIPVVMALATGQDSLLLLFCAACAVYLYQKEHPFAAGLLLSLGSIKPQLFIFVPLFLMIRRDWKVLRGGLAGGLLQMAISFAAQGATWPREFAAVLASPEINPGLGYMPNLRGAAFALAGGDIAPVWLVLYAVAAIGCGLILFRKPSFETGISWALVCGLLVSHHAYIQDLALLLLPFVLIASQSKSYPIRALLTLAVTPLPCLLVLTKPPYNAVLPAMLLAAVAIQAVSSGDPNAEPSSHALNKYAY